MKLEEKKEIVTDLHEKFLRSKVVIITVNKGLNVASITELRRKLRAANIEYRVVKNTLLRRASEETQVSVLKDKMTGPTAIAISYDDPVVAAKELSSFIKDNEKLEIRTGVLNGKVLDEASIKLLATMPSREILLSKVLSAMNAVPTSIVRTLAAIPQQLLYVLQSIKQQKETAQE